MGNTLTHQSSQFGDQEEPLKILVVGASLSGLGAAISMADAGHSVRVIDQASKLPEVGPGLQITPNGSRLLHHWQLHPSFWSMVAEPTSLTLHRYTGEVLSQEENFHAKNNFKYGAPFLGVHRVDLQKAMVARARELGVEFSIGERVISMDVGRTRASVKTATGNTFKADLVVAADGEFSSCRTMFLGEKSAPAPTGEISYRASIDLSQIPDPELQEWVKRPTLHFWLGPGGHAVGYSMRGGSMYNIVFQASSELAEPFPPGFDPLDEVRAICQGWDPTLSGLLRYAKQGEKKVLMHRETMSQWSNELGNLVFLGDACHSIQPYLAQDVNCSLEDGAVLGEIIGALRRVPQLPNALRTFQKLRKARGESVAKETSKQKNEFNLPDGTEQEERDEVLRLGPGGSDRTPYFPSRWTCPQVQPWLYNYDAIKEAQSCAKFLRA
ncbi:FAD binding domain protein [Thozetella sp. PMI_491]|nr:FAD binding domain protein [Thozetella sp. PMI_491]